MECGGSWKVKTNKEVVLGLGVASQKFRAVWSHNHCLMSPDLPVLKFYRLWIQEHDKMDMKGSMQMFLYFAKIKYTRSLYFHESDHTFFFWTFLQDQENLLSPKNLWHSLCSNWDAKMNIKICKNLFKIPRHNKRSVLSRHLLYPYLFKFLGPQSRSSLQQLYKLLWFRWFITTNPVFSWSQGKKKKNTSRFTMLWVYCKDKQDRGF